MQRQIPAHHIEDEPMEDAAQSPRAFHAAQDCQRPEQEAGFAREFFRMTPNQTIPPSNYSSDAGTTQQRLVRQVSVPISEPSSVLRDDDGVAASQDALASQLAAALAANAKLQSQLDIQSAHAHRLEEKVVSQGQTVSALCVEVDRLTKDNKELNGRLAMQMEQRRIETEQFRHHLAMFKATSQSGRGMQMQNYQTHEMLGTQPRMSLPGSPFPPTKLAAVAPATAATPVRRMSTAMGPSLSTNSTGPDAPRQACMYPPRRMSTGAAATCA